MQINVAQLLKAPVGTIRYNTVDERLARLDDQTILTAPVTGQVKLSRTNRGLLADARFKTAAQQQCSRCLEDYAEPIEISFDEEYIPVVDVATGLPVKIPHESYA